MKKVIVVQQMITNFYTEVEVDDKQSLEDAKRKAHEGEGRQILKTASMVGRSNWPAFEVAKELSNVYSICA